MKYQVEFNYMGEDCSTEAIICCLTGLDPNDISHLKIKERFNGKWIIDVFRSLGYDTNNRFVKFDPKSEFPVIMRCVGKKKGIWYALIYHDGIVWNPYSNEFFNYDDHVYKGKIKVLKPYNLKITSMLQVWI